MKRRQMADKHARLSSDSEYETGTWLSDGGVTRPTYLSLVTDRSVRKPSVLLKTVENLSENVVGNFENVVGNFENVVGNLSGVGNLCETGVGTGVTRVGTGVTRDGTGVTRDGTGRGRKHIVSW